MRMTLYSPVLAALLLLGCNQADGGGDAVGSPSQSSAASPAWPSQIVSETGDISFPTGFQTWPTLGAWSTADETGAQNGMHQVYTSPGAIESFQQNGTFADGTVLVKEVRGAATASLSTGAASYATEKQVWFVMIKDASGRFPDNALWGDGWGWALFEAKQPLKQAATNYEVDCKGCHIPAEDTDWIYTEAYPVLWPEGVAPVPSWQN